jgi:hypothetical protein
MLISNKHYLKLSRITNKMAKRQMRFECHCKFKTFNCISYFAIIVDEMDKIITFIISKKALLKIHPPGNKVCSWTMGVKNIEKYYKNNNIMIFEMHYNIYRWRSQV